MSHIVRSLALCVIVGCAAAQTPVQAPVEAKPLTYDGPPPEVLEQHCHMGDRLACRTLGELYLHGIGLEKSEGLAVALFLIACDQGDGRACFAAGDVYVSSGDSADSVAAARCYRKACSLGEERGCSAKSKRLTAKKDKRS